MSSVQVFGVGSWSLGFRDKGLGSKTLSGDQGLGFRIEVFVDQGLGFGVQVFRFRA